MTSYRVLALFSGSGGASEAFIQDSNWEVQRIENNPMLNGVTGTTEKCVFQLRDELIEMTSKGFEPTQEIDVIWASPPCLEFSLAYSAPQSIALRENKPYDPDLEPLRATLEIIRILKPRYWVIENVRGASRWFKPIIGDVKKVVNHSIFMWGKFPDFANPVIEKKSVDEGSSRSPLRANKRALIPYPISSALKEAIENQRSILEWV